MRSWSRGYRSILKQIIDDKYLTFGRASRCVLEKAYKEEKRLDPLLENKDTTKCGFEGYIRQRIGRNMDYHKNFLPFRL
jgi:hypothetical protein